MFFKFTTAGESHGKALVAIIEGVPAGLEINVDAINHELWRRQQGYGRGGRMKIETDTVDILSGVRHGKAIGSPIALTIENRDFVHWQEIMSVGSPTVTEGSSPDGVSSPTVRECASPGSGKNKRIVTRPRPGHADLPGGQKYGVRDLRNILERASARETAARVACGAIAKQLIAQFGVEIKSHVVKLGSVPVKPIEKNWEEISAIAETSPLSCADPIAEMAMVALIDEAKEKGDTLGGIFEVVAKGVPVGLGSHTAWNEKLDGRIAQALMSIHAVKATEIGTGVENASKFGSEVHDEIFWSEPPASAGGGDSSGNVAELNSETPPPAHAGGSDRFVRKTNRAGGLEGGITNGEELRVRGYMKPISTLRKPLHSVDIDTKEASDAAFERSDITAVPAAGVIGESMLAIVLANALREKFGGDSIEEMLTNYKNFQHSVDHY